jgi:putative two-component system response regulator
MAPDIPQGLKGEAIPLCGRIVALADVYDALTSKRVYKSAFPHDIARSIIMQESGGQFDPAAVDAFLRVEDQLIKIRETFSEDSAAVGPARRGPQAMAG